MEVEVAVQELLMWQSKGQALSIVLQNHSQYRRSGIYVPNNPSHTQSPTSSLTEIRIHQTHSNKFLVEVFGSAEKLKEILKLTATAAMRDNHIFIVDNADTIKRFLTTVSTFDKQMTVKNNGVSFIESLQQDIDNEAQGFHKRSVAENGNDGEEDKEDSDHEIPACLISTLPGANNKRIRLASIQEASTIVERRMTFAHDHQQNSHNNNNNNNSDCSVVRGFRWEMDRKQ